MAEKRKFGKQTFSRTLSYHLKSEATKDADKLRKQGYLARVTVGNKSSTGGKLYDVWIHYPMLRKRGSG